MRNFGKGNRIFRDPIEVDQTETTNDDGSVDVTLTASGPRGNEAIRNISVQALEDGSYTLTLETEAGTQKVVSISTVDDGGVAVDRTVTGPNGAEATRSASLVPTDDDMFLFNALTTGPNGNTRDVEKELELERLSDNNADFPTAEGAATFTLSAWGVDTDVPALVGVLDTDADAMA